MSVAGVKPMLAFWEKFLKVDCIIIDRAQARAETAERLNATLIFLFAMLIPLKRSALYFLKKNPEMAMCSEQNRFSSLF